MTTLHKDFCSQYRKLFAHCQPRKEDKKSVLCEIGSAGCGAQTAQAVYLPLAEGLRLRRLEPRSRALYGREGHSLPARK